MTPVSTGVAPGRRAEEVYSAVAALDAPCYVVAGADGPVILNDETAARRAGRMLTAVAPTPPDRLGAPDFRADHGVRHAYMAGAMANGIASAALVTAMARNGYLASFGAAGLSGARIEEALAAVRRAAPGMPFACNLIHSPNEPALEQVIVDACLRHGVHCVEASAFLDLTPQIVRYRAAGLESGADGAARITHRVIAKVSRAEVAELFLLPAPEAILAGLVERGDITPEQARLARTVPVADDITAEADSGGHTDRRPLFVLLPEILAVRDRVRRESGYRVPVRVGAAGGIGTAAAAAAAFALGAAYVVTGSINQATVEAAQSEQTKRLLVRAGVADCDMAPSADMFEMGVDVQVLHRGTMFPVRAKRLYELYRRYDALEAIPAGERADLEAKVFRRPIEEVWRDTVRYFTDRDPEQIHRAEDNPKRRMALVFRWYLGLSSMWSITGDDARVRDYQVWCGPAMGAFNNWVAGTPLAPLERRAVADIAGQVMRGAAFASRVHQLRMAGVRLPSGCATYLPTAAG